MLLNLRVIPWMRVSDAELRGFDHLLLVHRSECEEGLNLTLFLQSSYQFFHFLQSDWNVILINHERGRSIGRHAPTLKLQRKRKACRRCNALGWKVSIRCSAPHKYLDPLEFPSCLWYQTNS